MDFELSLNSHPSEEEFEEYAFRRLSEEKTGAVEEHLLVCPDCQEALWNLDQYILLMKDSTARLPSQTDSGRSPRFFGKRSRVVGSLAGAAVGVTVMLGMLLATRHPEPPLQPQPIQLVALRGGEGSIAQAHSGGPLELAIDLSDLPPAVRYRVELVNAIGKQTWSESVATDGERLTVHSVQALESGIYWVRLYSDSGELLREFGLRAN